MLENLLNALLKLCKCYSNECFVQMCKLGETTTPYLMQFLNSKQTDNVKVKEKVYNSK